MELAIICNAVLTLAGSRTSGILQMIGKIFLRLHAPIIVTSPSTISILNTPPSYAVSLGPVGKERSCAGQAFIGKNTYIQFVHILCLFPYKLISLSDHSEELTKESKKAASSRCYKASGLMMMRHARSH